MELVFYTYFKQTCPLIPYFGRKGFFFSGSLHTYAFNDTSEVHAARQSHQVAEWHNSKDGLSPPPPQQRRSSHASHGRQKHKTTCLTWSENIYHSNILHKNRKKSLTNKKYTLRNMITHISEFFKMLSFPHNHQVQLQTPFYSFTISFQHQVTIVVTVLFYTMKNRHTLAFEFSLTHMDICELIRRDMIQVDQKKLSFVWCHKWGIKAVTGKGI